VFTGLERERNQQDASNLVFIIKFLSQHVSGIIMTIFRRTRLCITAYGVLHCNKKGGTICGSTQSSSPEDGHTDARNMLR